MPTTALTSATILRNGLARLKGHRPQASLRAVARQVGLSSSFLSKVFRGERKVPKHHLARLAKSLRLDHHELAELQRLVLEEVEAKELAPTTGLRTVPSASSLANDYEALGARDLWLLERWYFLPILNFLTTTGAEASAKVVATRLQITAGEARDALARLTEAGYLRLDGEGKLVRTRLKFRFPTQRSLESVRAFHRSMLGKADALLARAPTDEEFAERLLSGITFAGDPERLPQAKLLIEEALYRAAEHLSEGDPREVFQLNLQLFRLTK